MEYREIRDYFYEVSEVMFCLQNVAECKDGKIGFAEHFFHELEEHVSKLSEEKTIEVFREFERLATDASQYKIKIMIKDLLGVNMSLEDGVIDDTLRVFSERAGVGEHYNMISVKLTPEMFIEPCRYQWETTVKAVGEFWSFLFRIQLTFGLVCCEHGVTDMKTEYETFLKEAYRGGG